MNGAHHGADQPFDMAAIVRCGGRAVDELYAILLGAALQRAGTEFLGVVEMDRIGKPGDRPLGADAQPGKPCLFWLHAMLDRERDGNRRRCLERQEESFDSVFGNLSLVFDDDVRDARAFMASLLSVLASEGLDAGASA